MLPCSGWTRSCYFILRLSVVQLEVFTVSGTMHEHQGLFLVAMGLFVERLKVDIFRNEWICIPLKTYHPTWEDTSNTVSLIGSSRSV